MKLITPWKYQIIAPFIPKRFKNTVRHHAYVYMARHRRWEVHDLDLIKLFVFPGENVVDIGANVGYYTQELADIVGPEGRVFAFEPLELTHKILKAVVAQYPNVETHRVALSDERANRYIEIRRFDNGEINVANTTFERRFNPTRAVMGKECVNCYMLSQFSKLYERRVSFIKVDVEGHKMQVISGGTRITDLWRPVWMVEIVGDPFKSPIMKYFQMIHYSCQARVQGVFRPIVRGDLAESLNYFFIPKPEKK